MIRAGGLAYLLRGPFEGGEDVEKQRRQRHEMIVVADHRISGWIDRSQGFVVRAFPARMGAFRARNIFVCPIFLDFCIPWPCAAESHAKGPVCLRATSPRPRRCPPGLQVLRQCSCCCPRWP